MAIKSELTDELKYASAHISSQLNDLIKTIQWYCTFILATIAGVAKLAITTNNFSHVCFCIALIVAVLALGVLIWCVLKAQNLAFEIGTIFAEEQSKINNTNFDQMNSGMISEFRGTLRQSLDFLSATYLKGVTSIGLWAFGISVFISGIGILLYK